MHTATADVLLLGDSFTNIYSLEFMGWGNVCGVRRAIELCARPSG